MITLREFAEQRDAAWREYQRVRDPVIADTQRQITVIKAAEEEKLRAPLRAYHQLVDELFRQVHLTATTYHDFTKDGPVQDPGTHEERDK